MSEAAHDSSIPPKGKENAMKRVMCIFSLSLAGTIALGLAAGPSLHAQQKKEEYVVKAETKTLLKQALHGVPGKEVHIRHMKFPGGFVGGKHTHSGPVFVYILKGALTIDVKGRATETLRPGQLYVEPIGQVMQGKNSSTTEPTEILVFQVSGKGKAMMYKAKE
jgi:quercetin dioxygenase-like cupin family protein